MNRSNAMNIINLHKRMLRNVFLNVELLLNDGIDNISEYDLQAFMFLFFQRTLVNTRASAEREKSGRVDCVLYNNGVPEVFYELKTYFKSHEKPQHKHFESDIQKLADRLVTYPSARAFFVIAGRQRKFMPPSINDFQWLAERLQFNRHWVKYRLKDGTHVRLRPSQLQHYGRSVAVTWEVKK